MKKDIDLKKKKNQDFFSRIRYKFQKKRKQPKLGHQVRGKVTIARTN